MHQFLMFLSTNYPNKIITIGVRDDNTYFLPAAGKMVPPEDNVFNTIDEIEQLLDDKLTLITPSKETPQ